MPGFNSRLLLERSFVCGLKYFVSLFYSCYNFTNFEFDLVNYRGRIITFEKCRKTFLFLHLFEKIERKDSRARISLNYCRYIDFSVSTHVCA